MFVITINEYFTVTSGVTCTSYVTGANDVNYYYHNNTADGSGSYDLDCKETTKVDNRVSDTLVHNYDAQMLYIYGSSNDVDVTSTKAGNNNPLHNDAKNVKLKIKGITNPYAKFSSFSWTIKT